MKKKLSKGWWIFIGFAILLWAVIIKASDQSYLDYKKEGVVEETNNIPEETKVYEELGNLKSTFEILIENKKYTGSKMNHLVYFSLLKEVENQILKADSYDIDSLNSKKEDLKKFIVQTNKRVLPELRKEYFEIVKKDLWLQDITVTSSGTGTTRIHFTGAVFAANQNKQDFAEGISETMHQYRFKRAYFKWYDGDEDGVYYSFETKSDGEI